MASTLYAQSTGAATNSGSSDQDAADLSGTNLSLVSGTVLQLDAGTDLSGVGAGDTIYINNSSVANRKIFHVVLADDGLDQVTVAETVTLSLSPSAWAIGGRVDVTGFRSMVDGALNPGDTVIVNDDMALGANVLQPRNGGTRDAWITLKGKAGVLPVISRTGSGALLLPTGNPSYWRYEDIELQHQGSSSYAFQPGFGVSVAVNLSITDAPTTGAILQGASEYRGGEVSGVSGPGLNLGVFAVAAIAGTYVHDVTGDGAVVTNSSGKLNASKILVERCGGHGIAWTGTPTSASQSFLDGVTVYRCDQSGIWIGDNDYLVSMYNSILLDNGDVGTEYNVDLPAGGTLYGDYNCISVAGGRGGGNVNGYTLGPNDITSDPLFMDPDNATPSLRNFGLQAGSPCRGAGFPGAFPGSLTSGWTDMGVVQSKNSSSVLTVDLETQLTGAREESFTSGNTIQLRGDGIKSSGALIGATYLVQVKNKSDNVVVATPINGSVNLTTSFKDRPTLAAEAGGTADISGLGIGEYYIIESLSHASLLTNPSIFGKTFFQVLAGADSTPPSVPAFELSARTSTSLTFKITELATDDVSAQNTLDYLFKYRKLNTSSWSESTLSAPVVINDTHEITGLTDNITYEITCHAVDQAGNVGNAAKRLITATTGTTNPRIHTEEIISHLVNLIDTNLSGILSLQNVIRGDMKKFTAIADKYSGELPMVMVTLNNDVTFEVQTLSRQYDVIYGIRILLLRDLSNNEEVEKNDYADTKELIELLHSNYALPSLSLVNGQVLSTIPRVVEFMPEEDDFFTSQHSDVSVTAIEFDVVVRVHRGTSC